MAYPSAVMPSTSHGNLRNNKFRGLVLLLEEAGAKFHELSGSMLHL